MFLALRARGDTQGFCSGDIMSKQRNKSEFASSWMVLLLDLGLSGVASLFGVLLMRWISEPFFGFQRFTLIWLIFSLLASLIGFFIVKTYMIVIRYSNFNAIAKLSEAVLVKELILAGLVHLNIVGCSHTRIDVLTIVLDTLFSIFILTITRVIMIQVLKTNAVSIDDSISRLRVIVFGTGIKSISMVARLDESPHYDIIGFLSDNPDLDGQIIQGRRVFAYKDRGELALLREQQGIECILYANEDREEVQKHNLVDLWLELGIQILVAPKIEDIKFGNIKQQVIRDLSSDVEYIADGMSDIGRYSKRTIDFIISALCIVFFSPLMLIVYIAIKLEDKGPAIYSQERIGRLGKPFNIYKFRSMRIDAEQFGPALYSGENDPRLTKVGRFIRAHHLDELPQLFNVIRGDMAFIGPRPERQFFIEQIIEIDPRYYYLFQIRPGVTSYATLFNGYTDTVEKMVRRLKYDLYYLRHRSLWFDARILVMTFLSIVFGKKF